jgi:hypothetical protein
MKRSEIKKCSTRFLKYVILHHRGESSLLECFKEIIQRKQREILVLMTFHFLKKMKNLILYNYYICVTLMEMIQKYSTFHLQEMPEVEKLKKKRIFKRWMRNEKLNKWEEFFIFLLLGSKKKLYSSIIFIQLYLRIQDLIKKEGEIINMKRILNQKYNTNMSHQLTNEK